MVQTHQEHKKGKPVPLCNNLHLEGNISRISRRTQPDGSLVYDIRLAVPREEGGRKDFFDMTAFATVGFDPWEGYRRGMDCAFDCYVESVALPDGGARTTVVCVNGYPLPSKRNNGLIRDALLNHSD